MVTHFVQGKVTPLGIYRDAATAHKPEAELTIDLKNVNQLSLFYDYRVEVPGNNVHGVFIDGREIKGCTGMKRDFEQVGTVKPSDPFYIPYSLWKPGTHRVEIRRGHVETRGIAYFAWSSWEKIVWDDVSTFTITLTGTPLSNS